MKWMFVLLMFWVSSSSFGDSYADLDQCIKSGMEEFKKKPTLEKFEEIQKDAQEMVRMSAQDYQGYLYLTSLYLASGEVIGQVEARERAVRTMSQYMALDAFPGKVDFSKPLANMALHLESAKKEAKKEAQRQERLEKRANREQLPEMENVRKARELIQSYGREYKTAYLYEAEEMLNEALSSDPTLWEAYVELSNIYEKQAEYEKQFAAWQLAVHFGNCTEPLLQLFTKNLRNDAMGYEVSNEVTLDNPGPDSGEFFIWLNRDLIASYLPEEERSRIEDRTISLKKDRAECRVSFKVSEDVR
jgi:tetratricopeptide (TPR) repeat protein